MFDVVLFDLDGTLTDPFEGITNSIIYSLDKFGIKVEDKKALTPFIGPPLYRSFTTRCGLDDRRVWKWFSAV
jgi:phosphoglycolate phosphatase